MGPDVGEDACERVATVSRPVGDLRYASVDSLNAESCSHSEAVGEAGLSEMLQERGYNFGLDLTDSLRVSSHPVPERCTGRGGVGEAMVSRCERSLNDWMNVSFPSG